MSTDVAPAVYTLVDGVAAFRVEYLNRAGAWRDRWPLQGEPDLPRAVRVELDARQRRGDRAMVRAALKLRARGAALVLAMLIAALAAVVAIAVAAEQQRWFSDVANRRDQVQAQALALAGVQWARQIMQDDARGGLDRLPGRGVGLSAAAHAARERLDRRRHRGCAGPAQRQQPGA